MAKISVFFPECEDGFFGVNCSLRCGYCLKNKQCHYETGVCEGCEAGYRGNDCNKSKYNCIHINNDNILHVGRLALF